MKPKIRAYSKAHFRYMIHSGKLTDLKRWQRSLDRFIYHREFDELYLKQSLN